MFKIKLLLAFAASLLLDYNLSAQTTLIPDVNFEQALIDMNIDSDGELNGSVLTSDVKQVTSLDVSGRNIANLTGIQAFEQLTALYCRSNILTSLNVQENSELEILDCSSNMITSLSVRNNLKLNTLHCASNKITEINVSFNTLLEQIDIGKNQLTNLNVKSNARLKVLNCASNQLSTLDVTDNWSLQYLDFSFNNIDLIYLISNVNLEYLNTSNNPLTTLNLISLSALKTIQMVDNDLLSIIYFDNNSKLEYISCHDNDLLSTIKIKGADALKYLNCSNNNLNELDTSENLLLENLYCQNNKISGLDLSLNVKLTFLKCNDNDLEYLNLRNGQNMLMTGGLTVVEGKITYMEGMNALRNELLTCIEVDDETLANTNTSPYDSWLKDDIATYSDDCQSFLEDDDGDGVNNGADLCPDTPSGETVDVNGCADNQLNIDDENLDRSISLYPNPVSNSLSIASETVQIDKIQIYSILGEKVKDVYSDFNNIQTENLSRGIYIIRIYSEKGHTIRKLIKQ